MTLSKLGWPKPDPTSRQYPRYKVDIRVKVVVHNNGRYETIHGRSNHLGVGGMGVTLTRELECGTLAMLEFSIPNCEVFKMRSELRYRFGFKCGFQFFDVSSEQRTLIKAFCSELPLEQSSGA